MSSTVSRMDAFVNRSSEILLGWRKPLSVLFAVVTLLFAWSATSIRLDPGFLKLIPIKHPYMQTMMSYMKDFSGANMVLVNLRWKGEGDIYNPVFMDAMRKATDEVFFIPGINRTAVSSIFTPSTYFIEITEDGFKGEPVVPAKFSNQQEELDRVRHNVKLSGQIGLLVANNGKSALIRANLLDYDPDKPQEEQRVDYWEVQNRLEEIRGRFENPKKYVYKLKADQAPLKAGDVVAEGYVDHGLMQSMQTFKTRVKAEGADSSQVVTVSGGDVDIEVVDNPEYSADIEVNIIGFARLLGDVIKGLLGVFAFFGLAFL
ncbi:MAG TPA: hypothetical protein VGE73_12035, partial [Pseudolabrys sp.]